MYKLYVETVAEKRHGVSVSVFMLVDVSVCQLDVTGVKHFSVCLRYHTTSVVWNL